MTLSPILRVSDVRAVEESARGRPLMEQAGLAAAEVARELLAGCAPRVVVLAGPGNNGGDGFVVARWLRQWFFDTTVVFAADAAQLPPDASASHREWLETGGITMPEVPSLDGVGLIVDAIFGIGLKRAVGAPYAAWIEAAANAAPVLALDIPTGLDADTGTTHGPVLRAGNTVTFIARKPGLLTGDGPDCCGTIQVANLGLDAATCEIARGSHLRWDALARTLPPVLRRESANVNKGSFGTLAVIGGASGMVGAGILAGRAALFLGAGKIWVGLAADPRPLVDWQQPELMLRDPRRALRGRPDAIVIGPGLGTDAHAASLLAMALEAPVPLVADADALTLIAAHSKLASSLAARAAPTLLTPHPGEAARLLQCDVAEVQRDRLAAALALRERYRASIVLKGVGSVLAFKDGAWAINSTGNCGLASGGTGDVLSGMLGALLVQGIDPDKALAIAVCLHGAAADAIVGAGVGPLGITASEIAPAARELLAARHNRT